MYILSINMWFQKLFKQFFFGLDQVVFNMISSIYDLLISIARTSILSQADILDMANRVYKLLAVFMIFKVTLSLITYVVNPDDFVDKSKGISKLVTNIIISLGLLILTPYLFNMAYKLQTIILEDNTLATLIFDTSTEEQEETAGDFINSSGDYISFISMSAFFTPNTSITELQNCIELTTPDGEFNKECSGLDDSYNYTDGSAPKNTMAEVIDKSDNAEKKDLQNYVVGIENSNLGLMFRQDLAVSTYETNGEEYFIMEYKYLFSTVVGVVIILLLLTFCMDVAMRSIKLSFLQLIAPIPILSYIDPKSGKDGMFKKWYQLCFKTYISLFVRLLALYFAIYIISRVGKMVDIVDGTYQTNLLIKIFVIIGALMFAKQFPKILEGLGIKLDGDGKFFLNPLKKFEEQAALGKNVTGLARGTLTGLAGAASGAGIGRAFSGAWRGMSSGKGWKETGKAEAEMNRKMRQAKLDGSTWGGRLGARVSGALGLESTGERLSAQDKDLEARIKKQDEFHKSFESIKSQVASAIEGQKLPTFSGKYNDLRAKVEAAKVRKDSLKRENFGSQAAFDRAVESASRDLIDAENAVSRYLKKDAIQEYYDAYRNGTLSQGERISEIENVINQYDSQASANGVSIPQNFASAKSIDEDVSRTINELQNERIELRERREKAQADETAIK